MLCTLLEATVRCSKGRPEAQERDAANSPWIRSREIELL